MKKWNIVVLLCCLMFAAPLSASAATVLIDPGHGGADPGAIGVTGLREKEVNLDIALKVRDELLNRGYQVIMTRTSDKMLSLQERIAIADQSEPDILVSIHANSFHTSDVAGTLVLYYDSRYPQSNYPASEAMVRLSPESKKLAEALLSGAVDATGSLNRGLLESSVYMVRMGSVPSALIETAFLSNPDDEQKLRSQDFRSKMAVGIANGIASYLPVNLQFRDVAGHWAQESILNLYELGIVEGNGKYYFPDRQLTRAEFVTMLDRSGMLGSDEAGANDGSVTESVYGNDSPIVDFVDLSDRHWAYESIVKAAEQGALKGFPDGTIRPDAMISRAEVTVLMDRLLHGTDPLDTGEFDSRAALERFFQGQYSPFADVPITEWYADAVYRLHDEGLIIGVTNTSFAPYRIMTRAEAAVLIERYTKSAAYEPHII